MSSYYNSKAKKWKSPKVYTSMGKANVALAQSSKALSLSKKAFQQIKMEMKERDNISNYVPDEVNPPFTLINGYPQSNTFQTKINRIGNEVTVRAIQVRATIDRNRLTEPTPVPTDQYVRCVIFLDKQPNGAVPNISDIFQNPNRIPTAENEYITAWRNTDGSKRFKIFFDKVYRVTADNPLHYVNFYRKVNIKTEFNNIDSGFILNINTNAIYVMFFTNEPANNKKVKILLYTRSRFTDM